MSLLVERQTVRFSSASENRFLLIGMTVSGRPRVGLPKAEFVKGAAIFPM
jgi:hypothetical protein